MLSIMSDEQCAMTRNLETASSNLAPSTRCAAVCGIMSYGKLAGASGKKEHYMERRIYKQFRVEVKRQRLPNGRFVDIERVARPNASAIIALVKCKDGKKKIVMNWQYRPAISKWVYEIPAGKVDPGETPKQAAIRELREETGFIAKRVRLLGWHYPTPGYSSEKIYIYCANCIMKGTQNPERGEVLKNRLFTIAEVYKLISRGLIRDGKTLVALFEYMMHS